MCELTEAYPIGLWESLRSGRFFELRVNGTARTHARARARRADTGARNQGDIIPLKSEGAVASPYNVSAFSLRALRSKRVALLLPLHLFDTLPIKVLALGEEKRR